MNPKRGVNAYKQADVLTASKETILLMLYEGAIRFVRSGIEALEAGKIEERSKQFLRAQDIITELRCTLDFKAAKDIAENLERLYEYATDRLIQANINHSAAPAREALKVLEELHSTWSEAISLLKKEKENEAKNATSNPAENK
jgi:flagellar secretion chaperone FliS